MEVGGGLRWQNSVNELKEDWNWLWQVTDISQMQSAPNLVPVFILLHKSDLKCTLGTGRLGSREPLFVVHALI